MKNGYDIEVSGINHPKKGCYCNYVAVWDVRKGKDNQAKSVEYARDIKNLLELKNVLDKLCEKYGCKHRVKAKGAVLIKDKEILEPIRKEYNQLSKEMKELLSGWINEYIQPAKNVNHQQSSYRLKHLFEAVVHEYVSNDQFKAAMLKAGYTPLDSKELNWHFRIRKVGLQLKKKSFYDWCIANHIDRDSGAGDLAKDMLSDPRFPQTVTPKSVILNYLRRRGACEAAIVTFNRVWKRYEDEVLNIHQAR